MYYNVIDSQLRNNITIKYLNYRETVTNTLNYILYINQILNHGRVKSTAEIQLATPASTSPSYQCSAQWGK